jgi:hypothetical protein
MVLRNDEKDGYNICISLIYSMHAMIRYQHYRMMFTQPCACKLLYIWYNNCNSLTYGKHFIDICNSFQYGKKLVLLYQFMIFVVELFNILICLFGWNGKI